VGALPPIRDTLIEGFGHFVTSMTAPIASGWSDCRVGLAPTGKTPPLHGAHPERTLGAPWFLVPKAFINIKFHGNPSANAGRGKL
jgi:hypothetical protein